MTALAMTQPPESRPKSKDVGCWHCGRMVAFWRNGKLYIKCRRCKELMEVMVDGDGGAKKPLTI